MLHPNFFWRVHVLFRPFFISVGQHVSTTRNAYILRQYPVNIVHTQHCIIKRFLSSVRSVSLEYCFHVVFDTVCLTNFEKNEIWPVAGMIVWMQLQMGARKYQKSFWFVVCNLSNYQQQLPKTNDNCHMSQCKNCNYTSYVATRDNYHWSLSSVVGNSINYIRRTKNFSSIYEHPRKVCKPRAGSGSCGFLLEQARSVSWLDVVRGD